MLPPYSSTLIWVSKSIIYLIYLPTPALPALAYSTYDSRHSTLETTHTQCAAIPSLITARPPCPPALPPAVSHTPDDACCQLILRSILQLHHHRRAALGFPHAHRALPAQKGEKGLHPASNSQSQGPAAVPIRPVVHWPQPYPISSIPPPRRLFRIHLALPRTSAGARPRIRHGTVRYGAAALHGTDGQQIRRDCDGRRIHRIHTHTRRRIARHRT